MLTVTIGKSEIVRKQTIRVNGRVHPRLELYSFSDGSYLLAADGNTAKGFRGSFQEIQKALPLIIQILMPGEEISIETGGSHPQASEYSTGPAVKVPPRFDPAHLAPEVHFEKAKEYNDALDVLGYESGNVAEDFRKSVLGEDAE